MNLLDRLEANSTWIPESGCRVWLGMIHKEHGRIKVAGKARDVHRVAWEMERGPIPNGLWVLHDCGVGSCFNVAHLRLGTRTENRRDLNRPGGYDYFFQHGSMVPRSRVPVTDNPPARKPKSNDAPLDHAELLRIISYDPVLGDLRWRARDDRDHSWNMRFADEIAGSDQANGYHYVNFNGKLRLAHRIAWFYMTGDWPVGQIDHINGIRSDNRWLNLRVVTQTQNSANQGLRSTNSSGVKGVSWSKAKNLWLATIVVNGKSIFLGYHKTLDEAASARAAANEKYHGEHNRVDPSFAPVPFSHRRNDQSGVKGVSFDKKQQKWFASITAKGKATFLGRFKTFEEAAAARRAAEALHHGDFASQGTH
jgi:hypothetical protein